MPDTTLQEIREILKEVSESQKETEKRFRETDAQFKQMKREMAERDKVTEKRINKAFDLFETQWGKLIESLVKGDLIRLLQEKGIDVDYTSTNVKGKKKGHNFEFDIIAHNGDEIVVVEVKTTLRAKHVKQFIQQLKGFKELLPKYEETKVYGAIAFLNEADNAATFAEKQKLFVIRATGDSAAIVNAEGFVPRVF